jgi:hypothetical protein
MKLPRKRAKGLVVHPLPDETLIYDLENDRALALNPTAALVFSRCDGETPVDEVARELAQRCGVPEGGPLVQLALDELTGARLVEKQNGARAKLPRREVLRQLKVAATLLPAVFALLAPTAGSAASYVPQPVCNTTRSPLGCQAIFANMKCSQPLPQKFCRSRGTMAASRSCSCR